MADNVPFWSHQYFLYLGLLIFARGMDLLSTRVATPTLALEGNPVAKKMGWAGGIVVSLVLSIILGRWPVAAVVISTSSLLIAAHNFQNAWLMRSLGEEAYKTWRVERIQETPIVLYLSCLFGQTGLTALVGIGLLYFSQLGTISEAIGWGIVCYSIAVTYYTLLSLWRMRRAMG